VQLRPAHVVPTQLWFSTAAVGVLTVRFAQVRGSGHSRSVSSQAIRRAVGGPGRLQVRLPSSWNLTPKALRAMHMRVWVDDATAGSCAVDLATIHGRTRPPACWRPYADSSPFNQLLPEQTAAVPGSQAMVDRILGAGAIDSLVAGKAMTPDDDYGRPVYFADASDPLRSVHCVEDWGRCPLEGEQVRLPAAATAASGTDGHLSVVDTTTGWEYDFFEARTPAVGDRLTVGWGGRTRIDGDGLGSGATAAEFGSYAGIIRLEELKGGEIDHALFFYAPCDSGSFVYPASKTGYTCPDRAGAPPMGTRLRLTRTVAQIQAMDVPAWKKTILRAMSRYGLIMGDTGPSWGLKEESARVYTAFGAPDAWTAWAHAQPGVTSWQGKDYLGLAAGIDWDKELQVVAPCVSQRAC
jgi:hypothetical protein